MMWQQYRKRLGIMQITIAILCVAILALTRGNIVAVLTGFVTMQVGSIAGAWYGMHLRTRLLAQPEVLPLSKR